MFKMLSFRLYLIINKKDIQFVHKLLDNPSYNDFSDQFFCIFEIIIVCFVVAICDLVHAVEAMYGIP